MQVLQIIPRCPPPVCGVADYTLKITKALYDQHQIQSTFLTATSHLPARTSWEGIPTEAVGRRSGNEFYKQLTAPRRDVAGIIVQYSAYGFNPRGAPLWLALGLLRLKRTNPSLPVHVMFHELGTKGPWHSSSFWNWPLQQWIIKQLARMSTVCFTNRASFANELRAYRHPKSTPIEVLPVVSGFGEPEVCTPFSDRRPEMVYFSWSIPPVMGRKFSERLKAAIQMTGARKLIVLRHPLPTEFSPGIPVESFGILSTEEISSRLAQIRFAFSDYNPAYLGKSSLFAAFSAHSLTTVLHQGEGKLDDGLMVGDHVLSADHPQSDNFEEVGKSARAWYSDHNIPKTAARYATAIASATNRP